MSRRVLFTACAIAFASIATSQTIQAPTPAKRTEVTVPSIPEVVCSATAYSSALECKPSGQYSCPVEVLYRRGPRAPVQACPAQCAPQSASAGKCDCSFVEAECRDRPRGR
jgi:hypothetical protein